MKLIDPRKNIDFFHRLRASLDDPRAAERQAREEQRDMAYMSRLCDFTGNAKGVARLIAVLKTLKQESLWDAADTHVMCGADPDKVADAMLMMHAGGGQ